MNINKLYPNLNLDFNIEHITCDSSDVVNGSLFIAIKGKEFDGHNFINESINKGAIFIVSNIDLNISVPYIKVKDTKLELIDICQKYYNYIPNNPLICGITGTDGKTTTSLILHHILDYKSTSSYIGTNGVKSNFINLKTKNTTISPILLYKYLNEFNNHNVNFSVIEVSSKGILDKRIEKLRFQGAIFTNLSPEHLNTHKTMANYFKAKLLLFQHLDEKAITVTNADCKYGKRIKNFTKSKVITYGINSGMYQAIDAVIKTNSIEYKLFYKQQYLGNVYVPLFGTYNIYNSLAAIAYAHEIGLDINLILTRLKTLPSIEGRFEQISHENNTYVIDFAHTPNGLYSLLSNLKQIPHNNIILVLGAAGEKDNKKRKDMGKIACSLANIVIFTSEDPKKESLFNIFKDLTKDIKEDYYLTLSRKDAINLAMNIKEDNDIIVITGKGNETYENINGHLFKHNDMSEIKKHLDTFNKKSASIN